MTRHGERPRDLAFMGWVKLQRCLLRDVAGAGACEGAVEADHAGCRFKQGDGRRAEDWTCIPLCNAHHRARTERRGYFAGCSWERLMVWRQLAIGATLHRWRAHLDAWKSPAIPF